MAENQNAHPHAEHDQPEGLDNTEKNPDDWVTGDEPATGAQLSYLHTLAKAKGEEVPNDITKGDASKMIDRLKAETGG